MGKLEKYELTISSNEIKSTDSRFTMDDLSLGDNYEFLDVFFINSNDEIIRRNKKKRERNKSNQVLPVPGAPRNTMFFEDNKRSE